MPGLNSTNRLRSTLRFQTLEERAVPAVYTVSSIGDTIARDGKVTLREAITAINNRAASGDAVAGSWGSNTIRFNIPGSGVDKIYLNSGLPAVNSTVVIDATTDSSYRGRPVVQIDGSRAGYADGLTLRGNNSTVKGLVVTNFRNNGIVVNADGCTITNTWVGLDNSGYYDAGNKADGIQINGSRNTVGGYRASDRVVVSGNDGNGIHLSGSRSAYNQILGDYIGTDYTGFASIANSTGIRIDGGSHHNTIGGTSAAARNVLAGNKVDQILLSGRGANSNTIQGNFIGPDSSGEAASLSGRDGIRLEYGASYNTIGGTSTGAGNLISGAAHMPGYSRTPIGSGIEIVGSGTTGNVIQGNRIGMDAAGLGKLENLGGGIIINGATGNTIGGSTKAAKNVLADPKNSPGLGSTNQVLDPFWYVNSIVFKRNPSLIWGSFRA